MSKQLILIRHANARTGTLGLTDFDRTLDSVGVNEAQEMAFRLRNRKLIPDLMVSSPAIRAISTAKIFAGIWDKEHHSILEKLTLYDASIPALLSVVNGLDNGASSAAIFGHNPEISALAGYLADEGVYTMPTCGIVVITFELEAWSEVSKAQGSMLLFDYPGAASTQ